MVWAIPARVNSSLLGPVTTVHQPAMENDPQKILNMANMGQLTDGSEAQCPLCKDSWIWQGSSYISS